MVNWTNAEIELLDKHLGDNLDILDSLFPRHSYDGIDRCRRRRWKVVGYNRQGIQETPVNLSFITNGEIVDSRVFKSLRTPDEPLSVTVEYKGIEVLPRMDRTAIGGDDYGVLLVSDTHIGHRRNDGTSTFNERVSGLNKAAQNFIHVLREHHMVKRLTIGILGDIIQGINNYEMQAAESEPESKQITSSIEVMFNFLVKIIDSCYDIGVEVDIVEVTGSHGKTGKKFDKCIDNHDMTVYWVINRLLKDRYPKLREEGMILADTQTILRKYGDFLVAFEHGDTVQMYKKVPFYGLIERVKNLTYMHRKGIIDCLATGHFHEWGRMDIGGVQVILSGTLQSESNLGWQLGLSAVNSFHFFGIHDNKVTTSYPIFTK